MYYRMLHSFDCGTFHYNFFPYWPLLWHHEYREALQYIKEGDGRRYALPHWFGTKGAGDLEKTPEKSRVIVQQINENKGTENYYYCSRLSQTTRKRIKLACNSLAYDQCVSMPEIICLFVTLREVQTNLCTIKMCHTEPVYGIPPLDIGP